MQFTHSLNYATIIPVYNGADTVGRAIDSVLSQTIPATEIVVVDDGSEDDSAAIASRYSPLVRVVRQANAGPGAARNRGVQESSSEFVAFLDADDTWLPEKMERQLEYMGDPGVGLVHARGPSSRLPAPPIVTFEVLWTENCISLSSAVLRRSAWEMVGGFDESPALISAEDHNLWLRLALAGWNLVTYPEDLIHYTRNPGSLSLRGERFTLAILANYAKIGETFKLDPAVVRSKVLETHVQHGRILVHHREMKSARRLLTVALRDCPSMETICLWLTTFIPTRLLDHRRRLLQSLNRS